MYIGIRKNNNTIIKLFFFIAQIFYECIINQNGYILPFKPEQMRWTWTILKL